MLKLQISKAAARVLKKLPLKHQKQIGLKIQEIRKLGTSHDSKALKGTPYKRADVGEYRMVYEVHNEVLLLVILIGKRNDNEVYKKLKKVTH